MRAVPAVIAVLLLGSVAGCGLGPRETESQQFRVDEPVTADEQSSPSGGGAGYRPRSRVPRVSRPDPSVRCTPRRR